MSSLRNGLGALLSWTALGLSAQAMQEPEVTPEIVTTAVAGKTAVVQAPVFGVAPLSGLGQIESVDQPSAPVMRKIGSGSPELFVYLAGGRPTMSQAAWMQSIGDELEAKLPVGGGTIHLLVEPGAGRESKPFSAFPIAGNGQGARPSADVLASSSEKFLANYFLAHPKITSVTELTLPKIQVWTVRQLKSWRMLRPPVFSSYGLGYFLQQGFGIQGAVEEQVELKDGLWYRLDGTLEWKTEIPDPDPAGWLSLDSTLRKWAAPEPQTDWEREHEGKSVEFSTSTKTPATVASDLMDKLKKQAQLGIGGPLDVEPMGGNLWQVELTLRAPELQIIPVDPNRTYPRDSFEVNLDWGPATGADGLGELPTLAYLAWRPKGADHFELLQSHSGRFRFPNGDVPKDVSLRLVIQADGGAGRLMGLSLQSRLYGTARAEFVAAALGEDKPEDPIGEDVPVEETPVEEAPTETPQETPDRGGR